MGKIVVEVMVKPEILDPQGKAIKGSLARLGIENFVDVRQGKRFTLDTAGDVTEADLEAARQAAQTLLSNPIIEDVVAVKAVTEDQA
ncbi:MULTISPECIES: phosphoribosylformylglycinamidine synthase subunit PurS [Mobiluncus]|uniref:Phosphoribosylformylglycinamidine synthase subunit PurS n=3 Tax=Mobiluncus TaxID=2050 RepID=D6ZKG6_MOBCV|nr:MULTISPECIES: phosphoribosylformylglycinamidine synthase subunit PurS [Mobiluncus]ADI67215.1 phosphoribosylformylglycinamidine synthase, purS protein [Mobiluncus curtisii ATCC 43063]EFL93945.1 phosphoribosylformylglycinamidine synthase, purS protein [Mobiluncus curtisii subsp. curtisii ATCC 35241]EFU81566.1 phosphoribosylformylglycinamidine synthase, purS protein [Mobiluncus holmesii ATCC 35242]MCU9986502.1 phosphoribosylformylglycinamidine synthase subunit PurS [Mobiluncus curtisii]MCV0021